jgi:hypothetical protein
MVAVGRVRREDLDLADEKLLFLRTELIPWLQEFLGPGCQLRILGDHAEPFLVLKDALTQLLVAIIEELHGADLVHPLFGRVMRRMRGARRILDEDRLVRLGLMHPVHVIDGVVGHRSDQIPGAGRLAKERIDLRGVAE